MAELSLRTPSEISERYGRFGERKLFEKIAGQNIALNNLQTAYNGLAAKYEALKSGTPAPPPVPPSEEKGTQARYEFDAPRVRSMRSLDHHPEESGIKLPLLRSARARSVWRACLLGFTNVGGLIGCMRGSKPTEQTMR